jgi:hypothetical protein
MKTILLNSGGREATTKSMMKMEMALKTMLAMGGQAGNSINSTTQQFSTLLKTSTTPSTVTYQA